MTQTTQAVKLMPPDVKIDMKDHSADAPQGQQDMMREVKNDKKNVLSKFNRGFADRLETAVANGANRPAGTGAPAANALTQKAAESWLEYFKSLARKYNLPAPVNFALNALGFVVIVGGCIFEVYWAQKVGVFGMLLSSIGLFFNWWCKKDERVTALTGKITELEQQIATDKEAADEFKRQVAKDKEAAEKAAKEQADEIVELTKQLDTQKTASDAQAKELRQIKQHLRTMGLLPKEGEDA